jgi:preprotein translocase subunit SecD
VTSRWGIAATLGLTLLLGWLVFANRFSEEERKASFWLPDPALRLGLDLQGGIHMVIAPDLAVATAHELAHQRATLESRLADEKIGTKSLAVADSALELELADAAETERARDLLASDFEVLEREEPAPGRFRLTLTPTWLREVRERAMLQALEVIRRRVDDPATGIQESVVTRQGDSRILVQIPGVSVVPDIFKQTGFLEFKIVREVEGTENAEQLLRARHPDGLPPGTEIQFEKDRKTGKVLGAYLVPDQPDVTGDLLEDARVQFDSRRSEWQVSFTWNGEGARIFGDLTGKNVGKQLAVVLDHQIYSAPVVRDRISRQGVITGRFSSQEAADLAVILRAGALPIPVVLEEERTIGPALGADSISRGLRASALAGVLVVAFMVLYYRTSGVYASVSLSANMIQTLGLMTLFEGTLTLPGIAGLALTVGMAVDANVLIFERIREELRAGKAVRAAISTGFDKAFWTIVDANVTTLLTALVLFNYGTGPIKGFAVTLAVGLVTNVFSSLIITRQLYSLYPGTRPVEQLSI